MMSSAMSTTSEASGALQVKPPVLPGDSCSDQTSIDQSSEVKTFDIENVISSLQLISTAIHCGIQQAYISSAVGIVSNISGTDGNAGTLPHSLGSGGFCDVTTHHITQDEASQLLNLPHGTVVAWKRYQRRSLDNNAQSMRACVEELRRDLAILLHPALHTHRNISELLYVGWEDFSLFPVLASRLAEYGNLEDFLSNALPGSITLTERMLLTMDVAAGLEALHRHCFVHRDLKLSNVLIASCPENGMRAVLTDFSGSIRHSPGRDIANPGHCTGEWTAPEDCRDCRDKKIYDYRLCDAYTFGLLVATLWAEEYIRPGFDVPCFLQSYARVEKPGMSGDEIRDRVGTMKQLPDDDEKSPMRIALALTEQFRKETSFVDTILKSTLCLEPERRSQIVDIASELGCANSQVTIQDRHEADSALDSREHYALLSTSPVFRAEGSPIGRPFQSTVLGEMVRVAESVRASLPDASVTELPPQLPDDAGAAWALIESISDEVRRKPPGVEQNAVMATLAFDIALCCFYGLGNGIDEEKGLEWLMVSAGLGNDWAMAMSVPFTFSVEKKEEVRPWMRLHLILSTLKGFRRSAHYLRRLFPEDFAVVRRAALDHFGEADDATAVEYSDVQLDLSSLDVGQLYQARDATSQAQLTGVLSEYIGHYNGFPLENPRDRLETNLIWATKAFRPPIQSDAFAALKTSATGVALYQISFLQHDAPGLKELIEGFPASISAEDVAKTNTLMLFLFLATYHMADVGLTYRWELGSDFAHRRVEMLGILLGAGADPFYKPRASAQCAFTRSLLRNDVAVVDFVIRHAYGSGVDVPEKMEAITRRNGASLGEMCIAHYCDASLDWLLAHGFCSVQDMYTGGHSMLHFAAARGHTATIRVILKHGADLFSTKDVNGLTPFARALIQSNNIEAAKLLLPPEGSEDRTRLLKSVNRLGFTCFNTVLHAALYQRRGQIPVDVIEYLVELKAMDFIVNAAEEQNVFETYFIALRDGGDRRDLASLDSRVFEMLLDAFHRPDQINVRCKLKSLHVTPLHLAVWRADRYAVEALLQYHDELDLDAPFNPRTGGGGTALDMAADRATRSIPDYVRGGGAREIRRYRQATAQIIDMLRRRGARPDPRLGAHYTMNTLREIGELQGARVFGISLNGGPSGIQPQEHLAREMRRLLARSISKDVHNNPDALDVYEGKWPKQWRGEES